MGLSNIPRRLVAAGVAMLILTAGGALIAKDAPSVSDTVPVDPQSEAAVGAANVPITPGISDPSMELFLAGLKQVVTLSLDNTLPTQECFLQLLAQVPPEMRARAYDEAFGARIEKEPWIVTMFTDFEGFARDLTELGLRIEAARFLEIADAQRGTRQQGAEGQLALR